MKIKIIIIYAIFSSVIFSNNLEPVEIVTEEWPPYNYMENGEMKGFSYDVVKYIINDLNVKADIHLLSAIRAEKTLDKGSRVMLFSLFKTPKRTPKYKWIGPINKTRIYFYKRKRSSLKIETLEDAKKVKRISTRHFGLVFDYLNNNGFTNLDPSTGMESVYIKVILGRNDLAISETELGVKYVLKKMGQPTDILEKTELCIFENELYIATSKDFSDSEIQLWQESFDRMKASGEYEKLRERYLE